MKLFLLADDICRKSQRNLQQQQQKSRISDFCQGCRLQGKHTNKLYCYTLRITQIKTYIITQKKREKKYLVVNLRKHV